MFNLKILNKETWLRYIKNGKLSIAVVGNAGLRDGDNEFIKDCNCVVRFNNYATRPGIKDNGTTDALKCDVLFSTLDLHSNGCKPSDVVIAIPFPFKQERIIRIVPKWYPGAQTWMVNPYENARMCKELLVYSEGWHHPMPSVGLTALLHIHNDLRQLNIELDVRVVGFEWYYNDETGKFQNWDLRRTDYPKTWNHFYPVEIEWIVNNLLNHKGFKFGSRCASLLHKARSIISERNSITT